MLNEKRINIAFVKTEMEKFMKDNDMSLNESVDYILNNLQDPKCKKCYKILSNNEADKIKKQGVNFKEKDMTSEEMKKLENDINKKTDINKEVSIVHDIIAETTGVIITSLMNKYNFSIDKKFDDLDLSDDPDIKNLDNELFETISKPLDKILHKAAKDSKDPHEYRDKYIGAMSTIIMRIMCTVNDMYNASYKFADKINKDLEYFDCIQKVNNKFKEKKNAKEKNMFDVINKIEKDETNESFKDFLRKLNE